VRWGLDWEFCVGSFGLFVAAYVCEWELEFGIWFRWDGIRLFVASKGGF